MAPGTVVLSPHLDDAVLSCWHALAGEDATVINVFSGTPSSNGVEPWWDRMTGASDPRRRMRERLAEDRVALAIAGVEARNLEFLDEQYRSAEQPLDPLVDAIGELLEPEAKVLAPAALGFASDDHRLVRAAGLELARRGHRVCLYADLPHAVTFGWPSWVTGEETSVDPAHAWKHQLATLAIPADRLAATVHRLTEEEERAKLEAVQAYATQIPALETGYGPLLRGGRLAYEVEWAIEPIAEAGR